jgi:hypothetical protein
MENTNKKEIYLILERSNTPLKSLENDKYILEGNFTFFDVINENLRIYQWKEFEPHFKILQEKIKRHNGILGEADHPENPTVAPNSLKSAAISIKHLEYDKENNCIKGRVQVLSTPNGNIIRRLIDDGVSLSISSRALGSVREDKTVAIDKLITYDLVGEPGFANANLTRVNESVGILNENVNVYKIPSNNINNESNIDIEFEDELEDNKEVMTTNNSSNRTNKTNKPKTATQENKKVNFDKYNEIINSMNENNKNEIIETLLEKVVGYIEDKITPQIQELTENVNKLQKIPEYINEYFGEGEEISEKLDTISDIKEYLNALPFTISRLVNDNMESFKKDIEGKMTSFNREVAQNADYGKITGGIKRNEIDLIALKAKTNEDNINHVIEYLETQIPKLQDVCEYVTSNGDAMKNISEYMTKSGRQINNKLENIDETLNELEKNANNNIDLVEYINYQLPILNDLFEYVQHIRSNVNNTSSYLDNSLVPIIMENYKELLDKISGQIGVENYAKIVKKEETDITEQVDKILEIAIKKKEQEVTNETLNFYIRQLDEQKQKECYFLTNEQKQKFVYYINDVKPTNINELNMIWNKVVDTNSIVEDKRIFMISNMPKMIKSLYEQLDSKKKKKILEVSNNYILDTPFKVQNFWLNRTEFKNILERQVMESYTPGLESEDYINSLDERKQNIVRSIRALNS